MGKVKRKMRPQPPKWWMVDNDNCWFCKNRNNCGSCKLLKKQAAIAVNIRRNNNYEDT
jgi:hypothetical protein